MNIPAKKTFEADNFSGYSPKALRRAIEKSGSGDDRAFTIIYNAFFRNLVRRFIMKGFNPLTEETAKDLTIEVLGKVWEKASKYDPSKGHVTTWIYNIADNHFIDYVRREQSKDSYFYVYRLALTDDIVYFRYLEFVAYHKTKNPEQIMMKKETRGLIDKLLGASVVGDKLAKVMELRYVKELSLKEIAKKLKMNDSTVRVQLKRGRDMIKSHVDKHQLSTQYNLAGVVL